MSGNGVRIGMMAVTTAKEKMIIPGVLVQVLPGFFGVAASSTTPAIVAAPTAAAAGRAAATAASACVLLPSAARNRARWGSSNILQQKNNRHPWYWIPGALGQIKVSLADYLEAIGQDTGLSAVMIYRSEGRPLLPRRGI